MYTIIYLYYKSQQHTYCGYVNDTFLKQWRLYLDLSAGKCGVWGDIFTYICMYVTYINIDDI